MTPETFIKGQLAMVAYQEAGYVGGIHAMKAVAFVIANRVRAGWHSGEWLENIEAVPIYRATIGIRTPDPVPIRDITFRQFLQSIDDIFQGAAQDPYTEGALFYAELRFLNSKWFRENVMQDPTHHPRIASVGPLELFK